MTGTAPLPIRAAAWLGVAALAVLPAAGAAAQAWLSEWSYDFAANQFQDLDGSDGWVGGWSLDHWTSSAYEGEANPRSDEGGGLWGQSSATRNTMTIQDVGPWTDLAVEAQVAVLDNDALGLVFHLSAADTFYLLLLTNEMMPSEGSGGDGQYGQGAYLYRVDGGQASIVAENTAQEAHIRVDGGQNWAYQRLRVEFVGGEITAYYRDDDGGIGTGDEILGWTDPSPLPGGHVGFYSYQMGEGQALVGFREPFVELADSDEDGVPNDDEGNPGDDDAADDDAADDDAADDDAADDDAADDDAGGDDDAADDDAGGDDDGLVLAGADCECRLAAGGGAGSAALAILALVLLARRRR